MILNKHIMIRFSILSLIILTSWSSFSQINGQDTEVANPITTAVPFLTIAPESRSGALGDIGVATSPDINSIKYNVAKYSFSESSSGLSVSYTPWLKKLVSDINLLYLSGFKKLGDKQTISGSLTYFSLGNIQFLDDYGSFVKDYTPNEFAVKGGYSRLLTEQLSLGVSLGYVYSNLTGGYSNSASDATAGHAFAADVGVYYNNDIEISGYKSKYAIGMSIIDIGSKMSYSNGVEKNFLPTTMRLGAALTLDLDDYNSIMVSAEFSKLLVPTPPIYYEQDDVTENGDTIKVGGEIIEAGKNPNVSPASGMFQSFSDAPGIVQGDGSRSVFQEELKEIMWGVGMEYWYAKQFALRAGYFHEATIKGNRKFFSMGLGLKYNVFGLDFAYLIPSNGNKSPLANTLRITLSFDFAAVK
jgi:hypothetical protein